MASLTDKVNTTLVRRGGQLVEEAVPTPTSQLAGQAGMLAPPTTPAGVAALGGTPQQQAMAGSAAQKPSALRQVLDTTTTLQEAEADRRYRSAVTAQEQQRLEQQKRLGEVFGNTQAKVQELIGNEMNKQTLATGTPTYTTKGVLTATGGAADIQSEVDRRFNSVVTFLNQGMALDSLSVQQNLNKLFELTGLSADEVAAKAQEAATQQLQSTAGTAAAQRVTDAAAVNVSALLPSLGTNRDELALLLGVPPEQIDTMTIDSLNEAVNTAAAAGADLSVAETEAAAQSGLLGAAERASLREASQEQSTTGLAASERQLLDLGHSLESADQVQFAGQTYTVEQLLSDESISKIVTDYLTNPTSESSKALEADPTAKGLLAFVNKYRDALTQVATGIGKATAENTAIQKANKELSNIAEGVAVPDELMKSLYGDKWGTPQAKKLEPTGVLKLLKTRTPEFLKKSAAGINQMFALATQFPELTTELMGMTNAWDLDNLINKRDANGFTKLEILDRNKRAMAGLEQARGDADALVNLYFGGKVAGTGGAQTLLDDAVAMRKLGLKVPKDLTLLDSNKDGKIDAEAATRLYSAISKGMMKADTVKEVLKGASSFGEHDAPAGLTDSMRTVYSTLDARTLESKGLKTAIWETLGGIKWSDASGKATDYVAGGLSGPDLDYLHSLKELPIYQSSKSLRTKIDNAIDDQTFRKLRTEGKKVPGDLQDRVYARQLGSTPAMQKDLREKHEQTKSKEPTFQGSAANPYGLDMG